MNPLHWGHGAPCTPQPHPCHPPDAGLVVQAVRNKGKLRLSKPRPLLERGECKEGCMHLTLQVRLWGSDTVRIQGLALAGAVPGGVGSRQWWRTSPWGMSRHLVRGHGWAGGTAAASGTWPCRSSEAGHGGQSHAFDQPPHLCRGLHCSPTSAEPHTLRTKSGHAASTHWSRSTAGDNRRHAHGSNSPSSSLFGP